MRAARWLLILLTFSSAACGADSESTPPPAAPGGPVPPAPWLALDLEGLTPAQVGQHDRALAARDQMFTRLKEALMAALQSEGPAEALGTCRIAAPDIAEDVAEEAKLAIGRTSFKLRNPQNRPPAWAAPYVEARASDAVLAHPDGRLATLLPIKLQKTCLQCHGAGEALSEATRDAIAKLYPDDEAVGFAEGELRGWFWVEVPAP